MVTLEILSGAFQLHMQLHQVIPYILVVQDGRLIQGTVTTFLLFY